MQSNVDSILARCAGVVLNLPAGLRQWRGALWPNWYAEYIVPKSPRAIAILNDGVFRHLLWFVDCRLTARCLELSAERLQ
jgi:hypothetical protein